MFPKTRMCQFRRSLELELFYGIRLHPYKASSRNNWSKQTIHNVVDTWNGCLNNRPWAAIFGTKFSSAMKHVSYSVGFWESVSNWREAITSTKIHCLMRSLVQISDWTLLLRKQPWNDSHREFVSLWSYDNRLLFYLLLKIMTWRICSFNKTMKYAIQL